MGQHSLSFMTWNTTSRHIFIICGVVFLLAGTTVAERPLPPSVELRLKSLGAIPGINQWDWWQARTAYVPGREPMWITTMSETGKTTSHDFHDIFQSFSKDHGQTWSAAQLVPSLQRRTEADGYQVAPGDLWPSWHAATQTILATGKTFNFRDGKKEDYLREKVSYAVMKRKKSWGALQFLELPNRDHAGYPIIAANAGCTQRYDLPDGDVLLPIRYARNPKKTKLHKHHRTMFI